MANCCCNTIYFYSKNKELLEQLMSTIQDDNSYREMFRKNGYTDKKIERSYIDGRDYITYCTQEISQFDNQYYFFSIDSETAWAPHMEIFELLIHEKYNNEIYFKYLSEEPGMEIFISNDEDKTFFDFKYYVYCDSKTVDESTQYFASKEELIDYIAKCFDIEVSILDDITDMQQLIEEKLQEDEPNCCFRIVKYVIDFRT